MYRALLAVSAVCAAVAALAGEPGDANWPRLTGLKLQALPTIDGRLAPGEWDGAATVTGLAELGRKSIAPVQPLLKVAWSDAGLLVAGEVPTAPGQKAKALATNWDGTVWDDDCLEIHVDHGHRHEKQYQYAINALGTRFDSIGGDKSYNAEWQAAAINEPGKWSVEVLVPWAAMGGPPAPGQLDGFNLAVNSSWLGGILTWSPVQNGLHETRNFGHLIYATDLAASLEGLDGRLSEPVRLRALGEGEVRAEAVLQRDTPEGTAQEVDRQTVTIKAPGASPLPLSLPQEQGHPRTGKYRVRYTAAGPKGALLVQSGAVSVASPVTIGLQAFIREDTVNATVRLSPGSFAPDRTDIEFTAKGPAGQFIEQKVTADPGTRQVAVRIPGARLAAGRLTFRAVARDRQTGQSYTVERALDNPLKPPWLGTKEGLTESVPAPWTPMKAEGEAVRCWGRVYRFARSLLATEVVTRDASVLAGPIRLHGRVNGQELTWQGSTATITAKGPTRVTLTGQATGPGVALTGTTLVEFDGMIRSDLTISPKGEATIQELTLEVPLKPQHARYLYHFPGRWGSVDNSGFLPEKGWIHAFKPFVWLGDEDRGFSWFCESDQNWYPLDSQEALTIDRSPQAVTLRCHLVAKEQKISQPLKYTFGFQATPVKHPEKTVWDYRITHHGTYGLESQPATSEGKIVYPAAGHVKREAGTFECWYRPALDDERNLPVKERKHMGNRGIFTVTYGDNTMAGTNCGLYWNELTQGLVAWSRNAGVVTLNPSTTSEWKAGQWYHVAMTWDAQQIRIYRDGQLLSESPNNDFLPGPLEKAWIEIGGSQPLATVDEVRILGVARAPQPNPGEYQPDADTLLLDHLDDAFKPDGEDAETTPPVVSGKSGELGGTPSIGCKFVAGKFGKGLQIVLEGPRSSVEANKQWGTDAWCFWEWFEGGPYSTFGWPAPLFVEPLRGNIRPPLKRMTEIGLRVSPYMAYSGIGAPSPLSRQFGAEWSRQPLSTQPAEPPQGHYFWDCCARSGFGDYEAAGTQWLLDELGFYGCYTDGIAHCYPCKNTHHGCGYTDDKGVLQVTWPVFSTRETLKRMYRIIHAKHQDGYLVNHVSFNLFIPVMSFTDVYYSGEHEQYEDLVKFRARWQGKQWGIWPILLGADEHGYTAMHETYSLLHGASVWPQGAIGRNDTERKTANLWKTYDAFGYRQAQWIPYYRAETGLAKPDNDQVKASLYLHRGKRALIVIGNLSHEVVNCKVKLDLRAMGLPGKSAKNALSERALPLDKGALSVRLRPVSFVLAWVE